MRRTSERTDRRTVAVGEHEGGDGIREGRKAKGARAREERELCNAARHFGPTDVNRIPGRDLR